MVAGDEGRAAFGFLGSTTGGNYQDQATYQGIWYFFVATTYDGGNTWTTVNATPGDPVQKGSICLGGLTCGDDRNLLDFNDITIDREGRVLAAYADGCVAPTCTAPDYIGRDNKAAIVRQSGGRRMLAAFDPDPIPPQCIDDNDSRIAYSAGWHLVDSASASEGHFRYHTGNSPQHSASLDFSVPAGSTGSITYSFAKSPKGGTADVYLDGVLKQTVNYAGTAGSTQAPEFKPEYNVQFGNLSAGGHKLEIENLSGVVYVDAFCLQNSVAGAQPTTGPGTTTNQSSTVSAGQTSTSGFTMPAGAQEISVVAESSLNVPYKLVLVNPSGVAVQTVDASNGVAVLNSTVNQSGTYLIKVVNVSLGPLQFTVTATPLVCR